MKTTQEVRDELKRVSDVHQWMIRNKPSKKVEIEKLVTTMICLEWFLGNDRD